MKEFVIILLGLLILAPAISCFGTILSGINSTYNPGKDLTTMQMIRNEGYPAEAHFVTTEDGYILQMHRIPGKSGSLPILVLHGILSSSADWVVLGKYKALAYLLADQGYDVWLGNFRGNRYSKGHVSLSNNNRKYWNFSFHELGIYDLPAMITYIANVTNNTLKAYIGHSMGTTCFYVMSSERPQMKSMVPIVYNLAPIAYLKHLRGPLKLLSPVSTQTKVVLDWLGNGEFYPHNALVRKLLQYLCDWGTADEVICANIVLYTFGFDGTQFNYSLLPTILNNIPAGMSTKIFVHFLQEMHSGYFRQYDYGVLENQEMYNSAEPPNYNLSMVTTPMVFFHGPSDILSTSSDQTKLVKELPRQPVIYNVPYPLFSHLSFLWSEEADKLVYNKLIDMLKK